MGKMRLELVPEELIVNLMVELDFGRLNDCTQEAGAAVKFDLGDVEYLPYEDACFDVLYSNFGLVFAPDHANVAAELARVTCSGGRIAFTAWKPNSKLGELYRRFTDEPIEGREAYEWGREDHVEAMLGEDFEQWNLVGVFWQERSPRGTWRPAALLRPWTAPLRRTFRSARTRRHAGCAIHGHHQYDAARDRRRRCRWINRTPLLQA